MGRITEPTLPAGATILDPDESNGLIPIHITTQAQLNEWEYLNILDAIKWSTGKHFATKNILTITFLLSLHIKMFNRTWHWAGTFRKSNKNIGVEWHHIEPELKKLLDDTLYQLECKTYETDELATRFHHRLVAIHLFPNGNGRHARFATDMLLKSLNQKPFSWGKEKLTSISKTRNDYIHALRLADQHQYDQLIQFVRS